MSDPYVPVVPPTGETLNGTYGAMLIGVLVAAILFGATNVQVYMYAIHNPHDSIWNKLVVGALWILDAVHTALCFHLVYWYLITNYYRPPELLDIVWSFKAQIIVVAILIIFVHTLVDMAPFAS
ncbi:uncharacterized protein FIBRA_01811 [Fibroporia radiculosa]|uniref:Uncharacterized protein n=1 Tax=Fibroporia radiculosa TaxID=599839 RepID=J4H1F8_9APHY|nr:uncharacterized protein FIBRA_01811 [Fibroporia radiculosa]CCL99789.1 predicted protein [Fibroporia radiculosa]